MAQPDAPEDDFTETLAVLQAVERGELTVDEAMEKLATLEEGEPAVSAPTPLLLSVSLLTGHRDGTYWGYTGHRDGTYGGTPATGTALMRVQKARHTHTHTYGPACLQHPSWPTPPPCLCMHTHTCRPACLQHPSRLTLPPSLCMHTHIYRPACLQHPSRLTPLPCSCRPVQEAGRAEPHQGGRQRHSAPLRAIWDTGGHVCRVRRAPGRAGAGGAALGPSQLCPGSWHAAAGTVRVCWPDVTKYCSNLPAT